MRPGRAEWIAALAAVLAVPAARGQPLAATDRPTHRAREARASPAPEQPAPPQRHSAASVAGAPTADRASGVVRPEPEPASRGRTIARAALFLPRVAFWIVNAPVRGAYWVSARYQVPLRVREALFNDDGTAGVVPTAVAETGFGFGAGVRFLHRDLVGDGEHLVIEAAYGGRLEPGAHLRLDSGDRLGRLLLAVDGRFEERPRDRFFGIGNGDEVAEVAAPVDPYADPAAVDSRFHQRLAAVGAAGELRLVGPLAARLSSTARWRRVDSAEEDDLTASYQGDALPGFGDSGWSTYSQAELALDTRERPARPEPPGPRSTGVALSIVGGAATDPGWLRYGGEARAQLPLGTSQRILVLRGLAEAVTGPLDEIPFVDLPRLGGPALLRGYPADRFRDRGLALASAEYRFDLSDAWGGFLFSDAGRVLSEPGDLADGDLRVGFGGGLDLRRGQHALGRFLVASSIDGGLFLTAVFDPLGDPAGEGR